MVKIWLSLLAGLLLLAGCGSPAAALPAAEQTARQTTLTAGPVSGATSTPDTGVAHSPIDNMPIIMGHADTLPRLIDGVLRSPIDNMPIVSGDRQTAPMPTGDQPMLVRPTPTP